MIPGEFLPAEGSVELNANRETATATVANLGDRPVQVGSHLRFFDTNRALRFDRTYGMRPDITTGTRTRTDTRFIAGISRTALFLLLLCPSVVVAP